MQHSSSHRRRGLFAAAHSNIFVASLAVLGALCTVPACGRSNLDETDASVGGAGGTSTSSSPTTGSLTTGSLTTGSLTTSLTTGSLTTGSLTTGSLTTGSLTTGSMTTGTGGGGACFTAADCNDGDNCTSDLCDDGLCAHPPRDDDNDGHLPVGCVVGGQSGDDCNDLNPNVFQGKPEDCKDGTDNDCNGVADCFDPACKGVPDCGCVPKPGGEQCNNGKDDDCDGKVDCNDADCVGTPACGCAPTESGKCVNGFDDDCDGQLDCADSDCGNDAACTCSSNPESCGDGQDNNCNGLVDCADPQCTGTGACKCVPPGFPEVCNDGIDDDCDNLADCADPDCLLSTSCQQCKAEICTDGLDNSCDGKIDCADPACFFAPNCTPVPEICNNSNDDDNDGKIDCQDTDCANNPFCIVKQANCLSPKLIPGSGSFTGNTTGNISETKGKCGGDAGEAVFYFVLTQPSKVHLDSGGTSFDSTVYVRTGACNNGKEIGCDDDSGGKNAGSLDFTILYPGTYYVFLDGYTVDPSGGANEGPFQLNIAITPNPPEACTDGLDNDGDHFVDCADPDCVNVPSCFKCNGGQAPKAEFGPGACTDGKDGDCDGKVDCADPDCKASDYYLSECCDGNDENGNGTADDFNCRCASDADCSGGQFCYTHTVYACGIPCDNFFGDVCPFVAAGSYCNGNTHQCEF